MRKTHRGGLEIRGDSEALTERMSFRRSKQHEVYLIIRLQYNSLQHPAIHYLTHSVPVSQGSATAYFHLTPWTGQGMHTDNIHSLTQSLQSTLVLIFGL